MDQLIIGVSSGGVIYDEILSLLNIITGIKWGYIKPRSRVQYVTSKTIPINIAVIRGAKCEKTAKYTIDLHIHALHPECKYWIDAVGYKIKNTIIDFSYKILDTHREAILKKVNEWQPSKEYITT